MKETLHRIKTIERFAGNTVQMVKVHQAHTNSALKCTCLDLIPSPLDMVGNNVNAVDSKTLASHVDSNMSDTTSSV